MITSTARTTYRTSAFLSLALFILLVALRLEGNISGPLLPLVRFALFLGVLGAAVTTVGMEYFLFGFDKSPPAKKIFWFVLMLYPFLGAALYCFIVYLRADVFRADPSNALDKVQPQA